MKIISVENAVGHVLAHDITRIIKDKEKGPVFKKGHIITKEDVPVLLSVGKKNIYIYEKKEGMLHENEAAVILGKIAKGRCTALSGPSEGKMTLTATADGIFKVDRERLYKINSLGEISVASRHGNTIVKKGDVLAGMRVIPLVIEEEKMNQASQIGEDIPLFGVRPFKQKKYAVITTGSEVYDGLIEDTFSPVVEGKFNEYDAKLVYKTLCDDKIEMIEDKIEIAHSMGAEVICVTGGMSVDPDDRTPAAIREMSDRVITYGAPVLPGAMFMLAYMEDGTALMGLPGCVMYAKRTIFDLVLPRVMADENVTKEDIYSLGEGGMCLNCGVCTFPNCGFGKGHI